MLIRPPKLSASSAIRSVMFISTLTSIGPGEKAAKFAEVILTFESLDETLSNFESCDSLTDTRPPWVSP